MSWVLYQPSLYFLSRGKFRPKVANNLFIYLSLCCFPKWACTVLFNLDFGLGLGVVWASSTACSCVGACGNTPGMVWSHEDRGPARGLQSSLGRAVRRDCGTSLLRLLFCVWYLVSSQTPAVPMSRTISPSPEVNQQGHFTLDVHLPKFLWAFHYNDKNERIH